MTIEIDEDLLSRLTPEQATLFRQRHAELNVKMEADLAILNTAAMQADALIAHTACKTIPERIAACQLAAGLILTALKETGK